MVIDTHSHIHFKQEFPDVNQIIKSAELAGVKKQIIVGIDVEDSKNALELALKFDSINWSLGFHPCSVNNFNQNTISELFDLYRSALKKPVAIGEIGLDAHHEKNDLSLQISVFKQMLELAIKLDLPVIIHLRDAFEQGFSILESYNFKKVLLHCFTGNLEYASRAWNNGWITSFPGIVTYKNASQLQEVVKHAPMSGFVVETDCPYLAPQKYRGKKNEPAFIVETVAKIANLKQLQYSEIEQCTTENALNFFNI